MQDHVQRLALHNEVHARPPEPVRLPISISHVVMGIDRDARHASREHLSRLLRDHHLAIPEESSTHLRVEIGYWRFRWELHTEFVGLAIQRDLIGLGDAFSPGGNVGGVCGGGWPGHRSHRFPTTPRRLLADISLCWLFAAPTTGPTASTIVGDRNLPNGGSPGSARCPRRRRGAGRC